MKGGHVQLKQGSPSSRRTGNQQMAELKNACISPLRCRLRSDFWGDVAIFVGNLWRRSRDRGEADGGPGRPRRPPRGEEDRSRDQSTLTSSKVGIQTFEHIQRHFEKVLLGAWRRRWDNYQFGGNWFVTATSKFDCKTGTNKPNIKYISTPKCSTEPSKSHDVNTNVKRHNSSQNLIVEKLPFHVNKVLILCGGENYCKYFFWFLPEKVV